MIQYHTLDYGGRSTLGLRREKPLHSTANRQPTNQPSTPPAVWARLDRCRFTLQCWGRSTREQDLSRSGALACVLSLRGGVLEERR